jgi:hypothetical protein
MVTGMHRRSLMFMLLLCLLLGILSTLALAWGCAALVNPCSAAGDFEHQPRPDGRSDVLVIQSRFGHTRINRAVCDQLILDDATGGIRMARWSARGEASSESRAGWPLRAFSCDNPDEVSIIINSSGMQMAGNGGKSVRGGWELSPFAGGMFGKSWRAIPLRPLWGGLLVDILVLATLWFALLAGMDAFRRSRRRERGLCPRCAYDLRSSGVTHKRCPECGTPV